MLSLADVFITVADRSLHNWFSWHFKRPVVLPEQSCVCTPSVSWDNCYKALKTWSVLISVLYNDLKKTHDLLILL